MILLFYWVKGIRKSVFLFISEFSFIVFVSWRFYFQLWMQSPDKEFLSFYSCNCFNLTEYWFQYMISLAKNYATIFPFQHSTFSTDTLYPGSQKSGYDLNIISYVWSGQQQKMPNFDKYIFGKHNYVQLFYLKYTAQQKKKIYLFLKKLSNLSTRSHWFVEMLDNLRFGINMFTKVNTNFSALLYTNACKGFHTLIHV